MITKVHLVPFNRFLLLVILSVFWSCNAPSSETKQSAAEVLNSKSSKDYEQREKRKNQPIINESDAKLIPAEGLVYHKDKPFTGISVAQYLNGQNSETVEYLEGKKDGFRRKFFQTGLISYEAEYLSGKLQGISRTWWKNGNLRSESIYEKGVSQGVQRQWYISGALFKEQNIVNGQEEGLQRAWRKNGKIYNNYEAKNGRIFGLKRSTLCYELDDENLRVKK